FPLEVESLQRVLSSPLDWSAESLPIQFCQHLTREPSRTAVRCPPPQLARADGAALGGLCSCQDQWDVQPPLIVRLQQHFRSAFGVSPFEGCPKCLSMLHGRCK